MLPDQPQRPNLGQSAQKMLAIFFGIWVVSSIFVIGSGQCSGPAAGVHEQRSSDQYQVTVVQSERAGKDLNLQLVGDLLARANSPEEFEQLLNDPQEKVNNLDLNQDGQVDYIKVREFAAADTKGFVLSTEPTQGSEQEIATISIQKTGENANVEIQGSQKLYGDNHYHHYNYSGGPGIGTWLLLGYLWSSHSPFSSPWGYGHYPSSYRRHAPISHERYQQYRGSGKYSASRQSKFGKAGGWSRQPNSKSLARRPATQPSKSFKPRSKVKKRYGGFGRSRSRGFSSGRSRGFFGGRRR